MKTKSALDTHNLINPTELYELIKLELTEIWNNPDDVNITPPIFCWGSPGCGKSSIVQSVCKDLGVEFIDFRASQCEPCDIRGLPVPNRDNKSMDWFVNGVWPRNPNGKGVIFLDELSSADKSCQVALYQLVLDRCLGQLYTVPPGYLIVAAGNTVTDMAVATTMSSALANRFMHVELQANQEDWLVWARQHNIHPSVIGFIQYKPEALFKMDDENIERGWPSPRSWERVSQMCHACKDKKLLRKMVYGLVGNGFGAEFMSFYDLNSEFDNVLEIMLDDTKKIHIPEQADKKYALCSSMVYLLWRGKDKKDEDQRINGFYRICNELTSDFATMSMTAAMEGYSKETAVACCDKLVANKNFAAWANKHKDALMKHRKCFKI